MLRNATAKGVDSLAAMTVLVTGATGLVGSNVCRLLLEERRAVRALVRHGSETEPLAELGVELAFGDLTDADSVLRAADGCEAIVNSAAVLGGPEQDLEQQRATNVDGAANVFDAGKTVGCRVVTLSTTTFFEHEKPLTESSDVSDASSDDPYTVTKRAAYLDAMQRADNGQDIVVVVPGGTFGPAPTAQRAMAPTSFNRIVRAALRGRFTEYIAYPVPWVFADDVANAAISAISKGRSGDKYLAFGAEDAMTTAAFLNTACELAGVEHRVQDVRIAPDDAEALERYGPSLLALGARTFPVPWFDNEQTRETLDYDPVPLRYALKRTIEWLSELDARSG